MSNAPTPAPDAPVAVDRQVLLALIELANAVTPDECAAVRLAEAALSRTLPPETREGDYKAFSAVNLRRCESPDGFNHKLHSWSLSDWFTAAIGEFGEAANIAKKLNRVRDGITGNKETEAELRTKLRRECGDALVYLDLLAQSEGFSIFDAAIEVFNRKSDEIGCPIKFEAAPQGAEPAALLDEERTRICNLVMRENGIDPDGLPYDEGTDEGAHLSALVKAKLDVAREALRDIRNLSARPSAVDAIERIAADALAALRRGV